MRPATADAATLLDSAATTSFACCPRPRPRSASTPARRAALRSQLADRSAEGQQRLAKQVRADLDRVNALNTAGLSHATRTSVEVVRSAYATALEGFALPYGDITVGGWRNTPYVVIQNVGAYLDIPRFLDATIASRTPATPRRISRGCSPMRSSSTESSDASRRRAPPGSCRRRS